MYFTHISFNNKFQNKIKCLKIFKRIYYVKYTYNVAVNVLTDNIYWFSSNLIECFIHNDLMRSYGLNLVNSLNFIYEYIFLFLSSRYTV